MRKNEKLRISRKCKSPLKIRKNGNPKTRKKLEKVKFAKKNLQKREEFDKSEKVKKPSNSRKMEKLRISRKYKIP